jgi:hypothetical protein
VSYWTRWREKRRAARLLAAELELREAQYRIDMWGFADSPKRRHEKEQRVRRAEIRLARARAAQEETEACLTRYGMTYCTQPLGHAGPHEYGYARAAQEEDE